LRWKAIQDAVFVDAADGKEKIWSESNVSEDFDMALRLILKGYIVRSVFIRFPFLPHLIIISELFWYLAGPLTPREVSKKVYRSAWMMN
jgi:hypothetical protein